MCIFLCVICSKNMVIVTGKNVYEKEFIKSFKIASASSLGFARKMGKKHFCIPNVFAGNIPLCTSKMLLMSCFKQCVVYNITYYLQPGKIGRVSQEISSFSFTMPN